MASSRSELAANSNVVKGGAMADLMSVYDWSQTYIGEPAEWSLSLKTVVRMLLSSQQPLVLWWGEELIQFYNDAYRPLLGTTQHPQALGQPRSELRSETRSIIAAVRQGGEAIRLQDELSMLDRHGYLEECYFNYTYSPVWDETGEVGGVLCVCDETTQRVVVERQFTTLRQLAAQCLSAKTVETACQLSLMTIEHNPADLPFALLYSIDNATAESARLMGTAGITPGTMASPERMDINTHPWSLNRVKQTGQLKYLSDLATRFDSLPNSSWNVPPDAAIVIPLNGLDRQSICDFLIVALSPRRSFDDEYRGFLEVIAAQIELAIANARASEGELHRVETVPELNPESPTGSIDLSTEVQISTSSLLSSWVDASIDLDGSIQPLDRERALQLEIDTAPAEIDRIVSDLRNGFATFDREWRYTYVNNRLLEIFKLSREAVLGQRAWEVFPHQVGIQFFDLLNRAMTERIEAQFEFYYELAECWVEHRLYPTADGLAILMADISDRKQAELLLLEQQQLLELTASGAPMAECLAAVCASVSKLSADVRACILLADPQRETFNDCIAPTFPASWSQRLEGAPINELRICTCGTAVYCGCSVTCTDIASDDAWSQSWRDLCLAHGVLACHSAPILNADDVPLGSLMLCFDTAREPTAWECQLADFGTRIASIVFERDRSSLALGESAVEYRNLFESIDEGFCIVEMMFDAQEQPVDYRFLQANPAFIGLTGLPADALGKTARELVPDLEEFWFQVYGRVALTGESVRFENESVPMNRWFDVYASRVGDAASRRVAIVFNNITERKQAEKISQLAAKFDAVRITLADALRPLADPVAIQATASRILGEHLDANRVAYFEVRGANYVVERDYLNGATSIVGSYPVDSFGSQVLMALRSGRVVSESDVATDLGLSPAERAAYAEIGIVAYLCVPLVKDGEFVAGLVIHTSTPRVWTLDEVTIVEEVAERTWAALEQARAEAALRESEAKYRTLFESMDEGYVLVDTIFDDNNAPVDFYYLEANPAAVRMLGGDPTGRRASEIFPTLESHWFETLGRVAQTGIGERHEMEVALLDAWYNFYSFKIGDANSRRVATIFEDVTERKRREANLAFLTEIQDEFARLVSADEIMQTVGAKIGAYLNVAHCLFSDIDEAQEQAVVAYDWHTSDLPSLIGVYQLSDFVSEEFQQAARARETIVICNTQTDARLDADRHAAFNVHAAVTVPCHCGNEWKYLLTVNDTRSRDWREDEIELVCELANRIFPRLERARAEAVVAANLRDTLLLSSLSARLVIEDDTQTLYREILVAAIVLTEADAGTVQIFDDRSENLQLISSYGFARQMTEYFYRVDASSHTPCGIALRNGERMFIDFDVPEAEDPDGSLRLHLEAGYRSAQSTPLFSRTGKPLGIISTHWRSHHRPIERELRSLDLLARQAADLIEQQQTTAALRESEEQLRLASEAAKVGIWFWNMETDFLLATEQGKALLGIPAETEMSYAVFLAALHPDDRQRIDAAITRSMDEQIDFDLEYRSCWSDGSIHWVAAKGSCSHDPTGRPVRMMGVTLDITALKESEFALRESEAQLLIELADTQQLQHISTQLIREDNINALYEQILDAAISLMGADMGSVQMLDPDTNELRLLAWRGFAPASAEFWSWVRVDSGSPCSAALAEGKRSIVPDVETCDFITGTEDLDHFRLSGIRAVQSTPLISRHGRLVGMISTHWREPHQPTSRRLRLFDVLARQVADLLDRKQVEIALQESQERLSIVQLAAKIGAWDWEIATGDIYWSPEYYTLYGIDPAVTPNYENWLASILEIDRDIAEQAMSAALQQRQTYFNFEFRTAHPTQGIRWIGARGQIFYDPDGQPQRVTGIGIDVTDRKQVQIALADRNQELDSFVHVVSHDLKAPLRAISNLSNWIEEDFGTDLPAVTQQQMAQLRGRVQRMEAMINGLLEYARVGRTDVQIELVSVTELLAEILDSIAPPSTFEIFLAPDLPTFHTKRLLLSQVFANLISNAFKHHDKSAGFIRISCQERGDFYEFAIADDGPGIAAEQCDRVFIIFQAANSQKNPDSTGIGLSIVKKIVETESGTIRLESELGKGTTFYFTWPK
jgi:PAS domain S-box-containing protein